MYKQNEYLRENAAMTVGQTFRIDLPKTGHLSSLYLKFGGTCVSGATATADPWRLQDHLGLIEVIANGATVIKSYSFKEAQFLCWLRQGIVPPHFWRNYAANTQEEHLMVLFGREHGDPDYGLDLSRYNSVELRITNSASATYYTGDLTVSIMQTFLRDHAAGFRGYLRTEEWRNWTSVSDQTDYYVLPTEYPIAGLYLRSLPEVSAGVAETGWYNQMDDIDFSVKGGVERVYKGGLDDLSVLNWLERGAEVITGGQLYKTADYGADLSVGRPFNVATGSGSKDGAVSAVIPTIEADLTINTIKPEAYEADAPIYFMARGLGYQCMAWLWHNHNLDADRLLDPGTYGEMRLNTHTRSGAGYAGGTLQIVLERLVV